MNVLEIAALVRDWLGVRLFEIGGTAVTGASILTFVVVIGVTMWISRALQRVVERAMKRGGLSREGTVATTKRLLHYGVLIVGLGVAMQTIGISLATIFAAGAVTAVAIGFALQNILQNFVSGVILLVERSIRETDILEVEGVVVRIERMGARATVARTRDEEELIIPNSILVQSTVKNLTLSDPEFRIRTRVGVSYGSDMGSVQTALGEAGRAVTTRAPERDPVTQLIDFGDSSVVWEVSIWAKSPWPAADIRSDLNKAVWRSLKDAGITIAFPQMDVHFDARAASDLAVART